MSSLASEATTAMIDRDLLWVADRNLMVASLSARLRDLAESHADCNSLHVSELWPQDDPFSIVAVAHQWALDGECVDFETTRLGEKYVVTLEPLLAPDGTVTAVAGRAAPADGRRVHWQLEALEEVEHLCGFGTWRIDARTSELTWSSGLARLLGASDEVTQDVRDFDHPEDAEAVAEAIRQGEITGKGYKCDHRIIRGDGTVRYVQEQARVAYDDDGVACAVIGSMLDITERKLAEERLAQLAHYDPVSNLPNRTLLEERLGVALARAKRNAATCGVLFLDVDAFKVVNDTYGHAAGDDLLAAIGSRLTRHIRLSDTVARISGDEFVVVLDQLTSHEDAVEAARKIAKCFDLPFTLGEHNCRITASIGVATYPDTGSTARELLEAADAEMYIV
ncbi:MAG: sensor domain-containing diguanylate cyclase, partial [Candidatus Eremiobacteraeota bacterium]|nr:sensor domain-containing diguanylate cyclase [Candidatus Eremiobacteraeota bacterium]